MAETGPHVLMIAIALLTLAIGTDHTKMSMLAPICFFSIRFANILIRRCGATSSTGKNTLP